MSNNKYIKNISPESERLIDLFLDNYSPRSASAYVNAIRRLHDTIAKYNLTDLNYSDFQLLETKYASSSNIKNIKSFFQFLYCGEYLQITDGFENCHWDKSKLVERFAKDKNITSNIKESYLPTLSFNEIEKLISFVNNVDSEDIDNLLPAFCFYMLYYTDIDVTPLKKLDISSYELGYIKSNNNTYPAPDKYKSLFMYLNRKDDKLTGIYKYLTKLGRKVGILNLVPKDIKEARKNSLYKCIGCGNMLMAFSDNWKSIHNRLICSECAEEMLKEDFVKKNEINEIVSVNIDILTKNDKREIEYSINTYEKLLDKFLNKPSFPKDFTAINEYLEEIGKLGEKYVYEQEKKRLQELGSVYWEFVDDTPAKNNKNGFDILSYTQNGEKIYIEVKTTVGDESCPFYLSENELNTAKNTWGRGGKYQIHRVFNVNNKNLVSSKIYDSLDDSLFEFENILYKVSKK